MGEMGVLAHEDYKVCGLIDSGAMVTVENAEVRRLQLQTSGLSLCENLADGRRIYAKKYHHV